MSTTPPIDDLTRLEDLEEGHSLWSDAWKRLKRNRIALISAIYLVVVAVTGFSAPLISEYISHFSLDEQHTRLAFTGPGGEDVSFDHPTYDGDKTAFAAIDLNNDGFITCTRTRQQVLALPGLKWLEHNAPSVHAQALTDLDRLDERIGFKEILKTMLGALRCPEIDLLRAVSRHYDFLFDNYDLATGDAEPTGTSQPDGFITYREFPKTDDALLSSKWAGLGLTGPDAFGMLDIDGDQIVAMWEVTERTRYLRYDKEHLIRNFDFNRDLKISTDEFPGAPATHVFWLGTDGRGRDVFTRLFYGARISMTVGLLATFVAFLIGVTYGSIAGYFGGRLDNIMMRIVDVLYGLPYIVILILLMVVFERNTINLFIALGAVLWLNMARVVRGQVIGLKTREYVEAARAIGVGPMRIIFRHLLRNCVGPVIVYSTLLVPGVILAEAFLSFLGLGVQPPDPSWGNMITEGANKLFDYGWLITYPGLMLATTLFAMNFLGDGVRDAIDPKMQKS